MNAKTNKTEQEINDWIDAAPDGRNENLLRAAKDLQFAIELAIINNYSDQAREFLEVVSRRHAKLVWSVK